MLLDGCKEVILKHANLAYALYCERLIGVTWGCGEGGGAECPSNMFVFLPT